MLPRLRGAITIAALMTPAAAWAQAGPADPATDKAKPTDAAESVSPEPAKQPEGGSVGARSSPMVREATAEPAFSWKPFGFIRMQYIAVQNDPNVAFVGRDDGFELQNARIGVHGTLRDRIGFTLAIDGAVDERTQINSPDGKLRVGLRDAYADAILSGPTVLRAGMFLPWVDPEALVADTARAFVDRPLESRGMRATEGWQTPGLPPGRSLGAAIRLDPASLLGRPTPVVGPQLGFELAIQNGADEFASNNDNDKPALSAAAVLRLPHDGFAIGAVRWNPRTVGDLPFRQDETDLQGALGVHFVAGPVAFGGGLVLQHTTFESTHGPSQDAYGAHGQIMVTIPASLPFALGYRFGVLDPSNLIVTDQVMEHTVGAVLGVPLYRMRFQLQLTHVQEQAARDLSNDRAQLAAELAL